MSPQKYPLLYEYTNTNCEHSLHSLKTWLFFFQFIKLGIKIYILDHLPLIYKSFFKNANFDIMKTVCHQYLPIVEKVYFILQGYRDIIMYDPR